MTDNNKDYIVRAEAAGGQIRAFAASTRVLCEEARRRHNTSPVVTAALGRLLTAGSMMGVMMKGDGDLLTLQIKADGPVGGLTVTADADGNVKGYANEPLVLLPANDKGKLDVGGAVGRGMLYVIRDLGLKDPYVGQTALQTGEIAEDLTYYFAVSEQLPSAVGLGVLMSPENTVQQAGGFLIQLMPDASEEAVSRIEAAAGSISSVTDMLEDGYTPERILDRLLEGMEVTVSERIPTRFRCSCSRSKVSKVLAALSEKDLCEMISEGKPAEICCHFCNKAYHFSVLELEDILRKRKEN